jgi:quercetin dioxygenase-like cupin family protein
MSLPGGADAYRLLNDEGEEHWFNGALIILKATAEQTNGNFTIVEFRMPQDFANPLHYHTTEDEFFYVISGELRFQLDDEIVDAPAGSLVWGPRDVKHAFRVDSPEARMLLMFGPGGNIESFFREGAKPARSLEIPPPDEEFIGVPALRDLGAKYGQRHLGPPPIPPRF